MNRPLDRPGCENCGMTHVPLVEGYCQGCTCQVCGGHGTMNEYGLCDRCWRPTRRRYDPLVHAVRYVAQRVRGAVHRTRGRG